MRGVWITLTIGLLLGGCDGPFIADMGFGPPLIIMLVVIALIALWLSLSGRQKARRKHRHDRRWIDPDYGRDGDDGDY